MELADVRTKEDLKELYRAKKLYFMQSQIEYLLKATGVLAEFGIEDFTILEELSTLEQNVLEGWDRQPSKATQDDCERLGRELEAIHRLHTSLLDRIDSAYPYAFIRDKDRNYVLTSLNLINNILFNLQHYLAENADRDKSLQDLYKILTQNELTKLAERIFESQQPPSEEISKAFSDGLGDYAKYGFSDSE